MNDGKLTIDWGQGRIDYPRATVPVFTSSELASTDEKARLFAALEKFANLGDTFEDYKGFLVQRPTFSPASIKYKSNDNSIYEPIDWFTPEGHKITLVYRDVLRRLWVREQESIGRGLAGFLLGIDHALGIDSNPCIPGLDEAWKQLKARYPWWIIEPPSLHTHWGLGVFFFNPITDFQRAAYFLFRESWRAKVCPCCCGLFIAQKGAQNYCSTRCYGVNKQRRGLDWWRQHGVAWRKARKTSAKKSGRKRGK